VTARSSGIHVGDAASVAPNATASAIRSSRVTSRPPQPATMVVQLARSQSSPSLTKRLIMRPRKMPKPIDAAALSDSSSTDAADAES